MTALSIAVSGRGLITCAEKGQKMRKTLTHVILQMLSLLALASMAAADFTLQLASFPTESLAEEYVDILMERDFEPFIHVQGRENPDRGSWYKVRLGPFATRQEALAQKEAILARGLAEDILIVERLPEGVDVGEGGLGTGAAPVYTGASGPIEAGPEGTGAQRTEELLTLNFHEIEIRELLSALAVQRGLNIVMAKEVTGSITVHLHEMTLQEAFEAIALAGGFAFRKYRDVIYFYRPKEALDPRAEDLQMRVFRLRFADGAELKEMLDALPRKGTAMIHEPSRTLIVEDTAENIKKIKTMLRYWDARPRQVMIEAQILEVTLTSDMSFGVNWQKLLGDAAIGTAGFSTATLPAAQGTPPIPAEGGSGIFGNIITGAGSTTQFAAALDALRAKTNVKTLSTPKILAVHGKLARVQVGGQQGYKVTTTNLGVATETINFIDTGTILEITPFIDDKGSVMLNVKPSINSAVIEGGIPVVKSTTVSTWLLAKSGETVFMGGLIENSKRQTKERIPCLGSIPGLGVLFGRTVEDMDKSELVVLITPRILSPDKGGFGQDVIDRARKIHEELEKSTTDEALLDGIIP